ncbi:MAG: hypothetical protein WB507_11365 [Solirubrobacterales bacterium]
MIRLHRHESAGEVVYDIAGQFLLEADARREGIVLGREFGDGVLSYRFAVGLPATSQERQLHVDFSPGRPTVTVYADGHRCLRHRWPDGSLCMWDPEAAEVERWVLGDGLPALATHARLHLYCEAECRAGKPWPKAEMAGEHPRKRHCPSCRGHGQ